MMLGLFLTLKFPNVLMQFDAYRGFIHFLTLFAITIKRDEHISTTKDNLFAMTP